MQAPAKLRVGHIPYLNCAPFFHHLDLRACDASIHSGVPAALNHMLQSGEIDVSPSSSFEYALNSRDYLLLPGHSISSSGPVRSVLLFSPCPPQELAGSPIALTGESATSVNLLRVLLLEYLGLTRVEDYLPEQSVETLIAAGQPALLIGDRAMQQAKDLPSGMSCYDLGELWYRHAGFPFVFALWILRRDSARKQPAAVSELQHQLDHSLRLAFADLPQLARDCGAAGVIETQRLVRYWQTIDYVLGPQQLQGLKLFIDLCRKHRLLEVEPEIEFFGAI